MTDNTDKKPPERKKLGLADLKRGKADGGLSYERLDSLRREAEALKRPVEPPTVTSRGYVRQAQEQVPLSEREIGLLDVVKCAATLKRYDPRGNVVEEQKPGRPALVVGIQTDDKGKQVLRVIPFTHAQVDTAEENFEKPIRHSFSARHIKIDDTELHGALFGNHNVPSYLLLQQEQGVGRDGVSGIRNIPDDVKRQINHMLMQNGRPSALPLKRRNYEGLEAPNPADLPESGPPVAQEKTPESGRGE